MTDSDQIQYGSDAALENGYEQLEGRPGDSEWLTKAQESFRVSDDWFDTALRSQIETNYDLFHSRHPSGSKYHSTTYDKRSKLFRPKIRTSVRKMEAAVVAALFATQDVIDCQPLDDNEPIELAAAKLKSGLVNYHLQNSIPWFVTVLGAVQDAANQKVVISHQTWEYKERKEVFDVFDVDEDGFERPTGEVEYQYKTIADKPKITLIPVENFRLSPAADWTDPINSSPFTIQMIPYFIGELKELMANPPPGMNYREISEAELTGYIRTEWDSVRKAREGEHDDRYDQETSEKDFNTVWVHRNIIRVDGQDWVFDTLGTTVMLSDPVPREEIWPTKDRPYAMGSMIIESHRVYPESFVEMGGPVQEEINEIANLRIDNIRLGISPRYFIRRGAVVDSQSLVRNVPGGITYLDNPNSDVQSREIKDVTRGSYEEAALLQSEMDDLLGTFSGASVGANRRLGETVGGMQMLGEGANEMTELTVRTIVESWVETVIKQLVELCQAFETDARLMGILGKKQGMNVAQAFRLMDVPVKPVINVGFGATNPQKRIERLNLAMQTLFSYFPDLAMKMDRTQVVNEVFGATGYKDGMRFFPNLDQSNPEVDQLQQQLSELEQQIATDMPRHEVAFKIAQLREQTRLQIHERDTAESRRRTETDAQLRARAEETKLKIAYLDHELGQDDSKHRRESLRIQREALHHSMTMDLIELQQRAPIEGEVSDGSNTFNAPGNDQGGVIARKDFGRIPNQRG